MNYYILFCSVLFCPVLSCPVLSCPVLSCPVLLCSVMFCSVLFCSILFYSQSLRSRMLKSVSPFFFMSLMYDGGHIIILSQCWSSSGSHTLYLHVQHCSFHLYFTLSSIQPTRELNVVWKGTRFSNTTTPVYVGIHLDRSLP